MSTRLALISAILSVSSVATLRTAQACDPAPNHRVEILESDAPACATVEDAFTYRAGELRIMNGCDVPLEIAATDCEACDEPATFEPGHEGLFVVESRSFDEARMTSQELAWTLGEDAGQIATLVHFRDNSRACEGFDAIGCTIGTTPGGGPLAMLLGLLFLGVREKRLSRTRSKPRAVT